MRIAAGAILVAVAMFALSLRGEEAKNADGDLINWEGKRDPFACQFIWAPPVLPERGPVPPPPPDVTRTREQLNNLFALAENSILTEDALGAVRFVDEGLDMFKGLSNDVVTALTPERDRLSRLRTVADRMYQRDNAERDFAQLNLSLTGVVRSKQARAILNSKVVSRGEVIAVPNSSQIVVVTDIQQDKIIVRFRGFLMAVNLVDGKI